MSQISPENQLSPKKQGKYEVCVSPCSAQEVSRAELLDLYRSVGWHYFDSAPDLLETAVRNSQLLFTARSDGTLVGFLRGLTDSVSICLIQSLLVHPDFQRQGIGRELIQAACATEPPMVRILLTGMTPAQKAFYESVGFTEPEEAPGDLRRRTFIRHY